MTLPTAMPRQIRREIQSWATVSKSPFSDSYYSMNGKTWNHTPEGCIRVSDHWNWVDATGTHCATNRPVRNGDWTMARYESGVWVVIVSMRANEDLASYIRARKARAYTATLKAVMDSGDAKAVRAQFNVSAARAKEMIALHRAGYRVY